MPASLARVAEIELDELDTVEVAGVERRRELGDPVGVSRAGHAEIDLAEEDRVSVKPAKKRYRRIEIFKALGVPEDDARAFGRGPRRRRRPKLDLVETREGAEGGVERFERGRA